MRGTIVLNYLLFLLVLKLRLNYRKLRRANRTVAPQAERIFPTGKIRFHNFYIAISTAGGLMNTAVIIPAYNESSTIGEVVQSVKEYVHNVIVVDDGSVDATARQAEEAGALVIRHSVNLGKGAALKSGCDYACQRGAQQLIVMDADRQHDPLEIPLFLEALQEHDLVLGTRQVPQTMPLVLLLGNKTINWLLYSLYGLNISDSQCGYRAFTAAAYAALRWDSLNYSVETEMVIKAGKKKLRYRQIPIQTIYRDNYKGTTVLDGLIIVAKMISWRLLR